MEAKVKPNLHLHFLLTICAMELLANAFNTNLFARMFL